MPYLSVVIPVYNSEQTIGPLVEALLDHLRAIDLEIVLVNDGSRDGSEGVCTALARRYERVNFISLRRNFGEFNAVLCGLSYTRGQYCVLIDDDFQNPPGEILKLLGTAESGGYDVVYSFYAAKKHNLFRNAGSWLVNCLTTWLLDKPRDLYLSSFKLIRQEVVREIVPYRGPYPYIDGLIFRVTRHVGRVEVRHESRRAGRSNYTPRKLISLFLNVLFGYSLRPLRLLSAAGLLLVAGALVGGGVSLVTGPARLLPALVLFLSGLQLLGMGLLGEYIGKLFMHQSGLPPYVVKSEYLHRASEPVG
jgi:glycosyltransferase involved in cell wall biosynthesis